LVERALVDLLDVFKGEFNSSNGFIYPEQLEHFNGVMSSLKLDSYGHIIPSSIIEHLKNVFPEGEHVIQRNASILESLIIPHACFPFSDTVPLTRDALCRAVILLTNECKYTLGGSMQTPLSEKRLCFIFSAVSQHTPTGTASYDDMLDVVHRLPYPAHANRFKGYVMPKRRERLAPVADRLEPGKPKSVTLEPLRIAILKPLEELVQVFKTVRNPPLADFNAKLPDVSELSVEQFVEWAEKVRTQRLPTEKCTKFRKADFLQVLDVLFGIFLKDH
jgi:hypothetical protein